MSERARLRAVVFDLDGTLLDSLPLVLRSIAHALEPFAPERPTMDIFAHLGGPPERFLPALLGDDRHVPAALERMESYHRANLHLILPFSGAVAVLDQLRAAGLQLAVWTGRDRATTEELLRQHGLHDHFNAIVCGDDLPTHKPDPAGLREIVRRLGVKSVETLFVGDADVDVLGGVAAGVPTVLIRHERTIAAAVATQCCCLVGTPAEAYQRVLERVGGTVTPN